MAMLFLDLQAEWVARGKSGLPSCAVSHMDLLGRQGTILALTIPAASQAKAMHV